MKFRLKALVLLTACVCSPGASAQAEEPLRVTLCQLLTSPGKFNGKLVLVRGTLVLNPASADDLLSYDGFTLSLSIRLQRTKPPDNTWEKLDKAHVLILGLFKRQAGSATAGASAGRLEEIRKWQLLAPPPAPPLPGQVVAANETSAANDLRFINATTLMYSTKYGTGFPAALADLGPSCSPNAHAADLIDGELAQGTKSGYLFTYVAAERAGGSVSGFTAHADPITPGETGKRHFFTDQSGVVRSNDSAPATSADPPIFLSAGRTPAPSGGVIGGIDSTAPSSPGAQRRIRIGGNVAAARLTNQVAPVYPPLARQARISGTVRLRVIIAEDGSLAQTELVSGHPLLVQAALDAVRQWRYQPTLLNGQPVQVETMVDVVFALDGGPSTTEVGAKDKDAIKAEQAPPAPVDPDTAKDIRRLLEATGAKKLGIQIVEPLFQMSKDKLLAGLPPGENREKIAQRFFEKIMASFASDDFQNVFVSAYAKHFSHDEIISLLSFYESPLGKRLIEETPGLVQEVQTVSRTHWSKEIFPRIARELVEEFPELAKPKPGS